MDQIVAALRTFWRFLTGESDRAEAILSRVFEDNFDGLVVIGEDGRIVAASKVASAMLLGPNGGTIAGRLIADVLPAPIREAVHNVFTDGRRAVPTPMAIARLGDPSNGGRIVQYVVTLSELPPRSGPLPRRVVNLTFWDETERRQREEDLIFLGTHDPATGALVRREFVREVDKLIGTGQTSGLSVLIVGSDAFQSVETMLGHAQADALLRQVFTRLKAAGFETIGRIDSQGFVVVRTGRLADDRMARFCKDLTERLTLPYTIGERMVTIGVSIGVAQIEVSGAEAESLVAHAAAALGVARRRQPASACVMFDAQMAKWFRQRQQLRPALSAAHQAGQMSVVYQPRCALDTGALVGVEAAMRWVHPEYGAVPPEQFLPIAEESGEIVDLGRWVLEAACQEIASWPFETRLAIKVTPAQFARTDVVAEIRSMLEAARLDAGRLEVDVAEGPFVDVSDDMEEALRQLRSLGVHVTLDDFGAGHLSLGQIARMPIDQIKMASRFVSGLPGDEEAGAVIRAVMTLSDTLGKTVIADGVENADQAWMLRMMGCRIGQGPFYGRPRSSAELVEWHASRPAPGAAFG